MSRHALRDVTELRRRSVSVYVRDLAGRQVRIFQGEFQHALHASGVGIGDVAAVTVRGESDDLRGDAGATASSMLENLENQRRRTLANDEPIAVPVEWARCEIEERRVGKERVDRWV